MNLTEFHAKRALERYGLNVPPGRWVENAVDAADAARELGAQRLVVKAQIHAGGRGPAGGIRFAASPEEAGAAAKALLGTTLVTPQTGPDGEVVRAVSVETANAGSEHFVAVVLDPDSGAPTLMASASGGEDVETAAAANPRSLQTLPMPDASEATLASCAALLGALGFPAPDSAAKQVLVARRAFVEGDMTLVEINPFAWSATGGWIALDAKVSLDPNALHRHPEYDDVVAQEVLSPAERVARENDINFVSLKGNIGVVTNGAGLGLATNDMLIDAGGQPANFMDIRTTARSFDIARGVQLLLDDPTVSTILLNVHGGGMTVCDTVAEGVAFAYAKSSRKVPIVARLAGQNVEYGRRILSDRNVPVELASDMQDAVARAVAHAGRTV